MNTLFADEIQVAKETAASSIPFEGAALARISTFDWQQIGKQLDEQGSALLQGVLSPEECDALAALYPEESIFRSRVVWRDTALVEANTSTSTTRSHRSLAAFVPCCIRCFRE